MLVNNLTGRQKSAGFTIVELLIVIVVIGILSALVINTVANVHARGRDAKRQADLAQIKKSLIAYALDNGTNISTGSGCGHSGGGTGWFNYQGGIYPKSLENCLREGGYMTQPIGDPSTLKSCSGLKCRAYMKYNCANGSAYVYANLETVGYTATDTDNTCNSTIDTLYGMNYSVLVPAP